MEVRCLKSNAKGIPYFLMKTMSGGRHGGEWLKKIGQVHVTNVRIQEARCLGASIRSVASSGG